MNGVRKELEASWVDPGYFSGNSKLRNAGRLVYQLIKPPKGHRTLPTRQGVLLILITLGIGTAAFNTSQNILYIVLALLLSSLLMSGIISWLNFKGCQWRLQMGTHFRAGDVSPITLEIKNTKKRLPTYSLQFKLASESDGQEALLRLRERIDGRSFKELEWLYIPKKRGENTIRLLGLYSKFPFGFLKKSISDSYEKRIIVWPEREAYVLSFGAEAFGHQQGADHQQPGSGNELYKIRPYVPGDAIRQVHWKVSAKVGKLMIKETSESVRAKYDLYIDPSDCTWRKDHFEKMIRVATSLGEDLYRGGQLKGWEIAGEQKMKLTGIEDLYRFMTTMALLKPTLEKVNHPNQAVSNTLYFLPGGKEKIRIMLNHHEIGEA